MRHAAASVTVLTTDGPAGRGGVTVSAFCSLSADPPSVLACVHQASPVLKLIRENRRVCVNLLATDQTHVADSFAGRIAQWRSNRFACAEWDEVENGAPQLRGALASFNCTLAGEMPFGSHYILIGRVEQVASSARGGLLYADRAYRHIGPLAPIQEELYT
ncbi:flavin reductase family protein [Parapusillimonas granuli]|nr:flavin reductase family protein [Parapusillimonas granuli]